MVSVVKCMAAMTGIGFATGAGASYLMQTKANKFITQDIEKFAKDGKIPIGGHTPDGKLWDGAITVDEYKKNLAKKTKISAAIMGGLAAVGTALISGLTLLLRGKVKLK